MSTIFTKIINKEIPAHFIYEDDVCAVFLDAFPIVPGQSLIVSKHEASYLFDLPEDEYLHLHKIAKKIALASDRVLDVSRTCTIVEGFEVPHVHIKLYPMPHDQNFKRLADEAKEPIAVTEEEFAITAAKIKEALED